MSLSILFQLLVPLYVNVHWPVAVLFSGMCNKSRLRVWRAWMLERLVNLSTRYTLQSCLVGCSRSYHSASCCLKTVTLEWIDMKLNKTRARSKTRAAILAHSFKNLGQQSKKSLNNERQIFEKSRLLLAYVTQGSQTLIVVEISNAALLRLRSNYIEWLFRR